MLIAELRRAKPVSGPPWVKHFGKSIDMRQILVVTLEYARPYRLSGWKWGGKTASGDGGVRASFLGGISHGQRCISQAAFFWREITLTVVEKV